MAQRRNNHAQLRFDERLVLNQWIVNLFEVETFDKLADLLKSPDNEGLTTEQRTKFCEVLKKPTLFKREVLSENLLEQYDENIVRHTLTISRKRKQPIRWKYFQYLGLLFTEIYLDRYFSDPDKLLSDLNEFVARFNADKSSADKVSEYAAADLNKIAFWSATGSGKTLLMHVNILQYRHYLAKHNRGRELNRVILLTPNEGLSKQHLDELGLSEIPATLLTDSAGPIYKNKSNDIMDIIDIHKLREVAGEKTVAVESFEGNNLVLVDEGHRGASGEDWMNRRDKLCEHGFSFEYSATFGQAMRTSGNKTLVQEYAKCILFDYSYKYFYKDGFGKDYRVLNLANDRDDENRQLYLTAGLLSYYQQLRIYKEKHSEIRPFLIDKPLWVFVGASVNAVRTMNRRQVSDVVDILLTLAEFVKNQSISVSRLKRLISGDTGLLDTKGNDIFANAFTYLIKNKATPEDLFADILKLVFNCPASNGLLHVENLKGSDGEIALRLGENEPFGVINVGDPAQLCRLCEEQDDFLVVTDKDFSSSLFFSINNPDSHINILVGSKKFSEGWNSWRVSTMGLMNIGRSEGSEIIQLFGRGVRLRGHNFCLKRSSKCPEVQPPTDLKFLETLNIIGIRADYMQQFKEYLEEEGVPANEDMMTINLPILKNLGKQKLKVIRLKDGWDYKKQGKKPTLASKDESIRKNKVILNWYPRIQAQQSISVQQTTEEAVLNEGRLTEMHLAFMDLDAVYFELQRFKNERAWYNLNLSREVICELLQSSEWYTLYIPEDELRFDRFDKVLRWQEIAVALLKKYCDRFYKASKARAESGHLEYAELTPDHPNFIEEYRILIDQSQENIIAKLLEIKEAIEEGKLKDIEWGGKLRSIMFNQHLYMPLVYLKHDYVEVKPASLEESERDFVIALRNFYDGNKPFFEGKELYLLRNQSRGRGIGFFEEGGFYPDFILWLLAGEKQHVVFIDPHGLRHAQGEEDPKINFHKSIKEIEQRLGDPDIILNSFVLSVTSYDQIAFWKKSRRELEKMNVLFQQDSDYVRKLLESIENS